MSAEGDAAAATALVQEMAAVLQHRLQAIARTMQQQLQQFCPDMSDAAKRDGDEGLTATVSVAPTPRCVTSQLDICPQALLASHGDSGTAVSAPYISLWDETRLEWFVGIAKEAVGGIVGAALAMEGAGENVTPAGDGSMQPGVSRLLLLFSPANYTRWGDAKHRMLWAGAAASSCPSSDRILEDIVLTTLVLSKAPKLVEVWQHRRWAWGQFLMRCRRPAPSLSNQEAGNDGAERHEEAVRIWIWHQDEAVLASACNAHPMNLNAWQYRRQMASMCTDGALFPLMMVPSTPTDCTQWDAGWMLCSKALDYHAAAATAFLRRHHADASCASFLVDLLRSAVAHTLGLNLAASVPHAPSTAEQQQQRAVWLRVVSTHWTRSIVLSSQLLTQTCNVGHECLWHLRLGLASIALHHRQLDAELCFVGNWTVMDELAFVAHHCGCPPTPRQCTEEGSVADCTPQGAPSVAVGASGVTAAWAVCSGSVVFHQWYASRYGVQFTRMLLTLLGK